MNGNVSMGGSVSVSDAGAPASLSSAALARRLADLCGEERNVLVDFLLHLEAFDRRLAWAEAGYGSLWAYCMEVLHLREGAAWRRIEAMKLLRRFPSVESALRDGRLCLTTLNQLGPVLTEENASELVARAAFLSKADTERLVVSIRPGVAPRDGIRRIAASATPATRATAPAAAAPSAESCDRTVESAPACDDPASRLALEGAAAARPRHELRPVSEDTFSLRVTLDAGCKAELDRLVALLSHKTNGDLAAVLREAIRCAIAKHGKRKGAVEPERKRGPSTAKTTPETARRTEPSSPASPADARAIPMEVRRAVWKRDGGRCAWISPDGKRCGSTWKLELGHLRPAAIGGEPTVDGLQAQCRRHNQLEAVRFFGREHMAPYLGGDHFLQRESPAVNEVPPSPGPRA
jgi:hypothetical protein